MTHGRARQLSRIVLAAFLAGMVLTTCPIDRPGVLGRKHDPARSQVRLKVRSRPGLFAREATLAALATDRDRVRVSDSDWRREAPNPAKLAGLLPSSRPSAGANPPRLPSRLRC